MGVVHPAVTTGRGSRSRCSAPTSSVTTRSGAGGPRGQLPVPDSQPVGRRDRRCRPVGRHPVRRHPLRAGTLRAGRSMRRGRSPAPTCAGSPGAGGGAGDGARGRRPAPRRQAVQRVDGGSEPDPDRLRAGPGRRRPKLSTPAGCSAPPATSPPRSCSATMPPRPPTSTPGRPRSRTPAPAGRRSAAGRRWRSWTESAVASTTSPASPENWARWSPRHSTPIRACGRPCPRCWPGCGPTPVACRAPVRRRRRRCLARTPTRCRWRWPRSRTSGRSPSSTTSPRARPAATRTRTRGPTPGWRRSRLAQRFRRGLLVVTAALAVAAGITAYPWIGSALLLLVVWVLRSASLAASATGDQAPAPGREVVRPGALPASGRRGTPSARFPAPSCSSCGASASPWPPSWSATRRPPRWR